MNEHMHPPHVAPPHAAQAPQIGSSVTMWEGRAWGNSTIHLQLCFSPRAIGVECCTGIATVS